MITTGQLIELDIVDFAVGGRGIGHVLIESEEKGEEPKKFVIFVDGALSGQKVIAKITKKKRRYAEAQLQEVLVRSELEVETGYQAIAGAPWANLPIAIQQEHKQKQVFDLFQRFAGIDLMDAKIFEEYIESPEIWNYRNKMEFSFGPTSETFELGADEKKIWSHDGFGLGSKKRGQYWLVENVEKPSGMFDERFESIIPALREWCEETGLSAYNTRQSEGFFRHLVVRKSLYEDTFLMNLVTNIDKDSTFDINAFSDFLTQKFEGKIIGIFWTQSADRGNPMTMFESRKLISGSEKLIEELTIDSASKKVQLKFDISLNSFFQTNPRAAEKLYKKTVEYVTPQDGENIFDCFCGTGTIAQIMSKTASKAKIYGIEIVKSAVLDARETAERNNLGRLVFFNEDVGKFLQTHPEFIGKIDTVVLDPPRAGIAPKTLEKVMALGAKKIVYVSCNPATMARDTKILEDASYKLQKLSLVDQFPHTSHVEGVGMFLLSE